MNTNSTSHLTYVRVPRELGAKVIMDIVYWLQDNVKFKYHIPVNMEMVTFHDPQDAVAFKLKFNL
jgi:hypothetical protein